jgi:hypothetical protein
MTSFLWVSKEQAIATAKCGGLSAAQQTMRLSLASVEMTPFRQGGRKATAKATHPACFGYEDLQLKERPRLFGHGLFLEQLIFVSGRRLRVR